MTEKRVAVVGVGRIGLTHADILAHRVPGAQLVAVTTSKGDRAAAARACCGDVAVYPTLDALLKNEQLDAVVVASSTSAHADNVVQCAAAGLHAFCEKPLALTLPDCDRAIAAAERMGVKLLDRRSVHHDMPRTTPDRLGEAFVAELRAFVDCVRNDTAPPVTGHDSRKTIAVGLAATRSLHTHTPEAV